jgi:hypothetical protein
MDLSVHIRTIIVTNVESCCPNVENEKLTDEMINRFALNLISCLNKIKKNQCISSVIRIFYYSTLPFHFTAQFADYRHRIDR